MLGAEWAAAREDLIGPKADGFSGPNPLGGHRPLLAASGVPPNPDLSRLPVVEPGLDAVVARGRNLHFSTAVEPAIAAADMVFLSVNTPTKACGIGAGQASDRRWIEASARQVAACAQGHTIVVEKSTLPVRTAEVITTILTAAEGNTPSSSKSFSVLS